MATMAKKKKIFTDTFAAAMDYFMRLKDVTNLELGIAVGYKNDKMIDQIRHERSKGTEIKRRDISTFFKTDYEIFLKTGEDLLKNEQQNKPQPLSASMDDLKYRKLQEHCGLIEGFEFQDIAIEINRKLVEYEKIEGVNGLIGIMKYINLRLDESKQKQELKANPRELGEQNTG